MLIGKVKKKKIKFIRIKKKNTFGFLFENRSKLTDINGLKLNHEVKRETKFRVKVITHKQIN